MPERKGIIPDSQDFLLSSSLYSEYNLLLENNLKRFISTLDYNGVFDCFCPGCGKESPVKWYKSNSVLVNKNFEPSFRYVETPDLSIIIKVGQVLPLAEAYIFNKIGFCQRADTHRFFVSFMLISHTIIKTMQYPSVATLTEDVFNRFSKTLGTENLRELNKAVGLFSHGIGAGSYVYLRRVIENFFITPAHENAQKEQTNWSEDVYQKARVSEKIELLKDYLPHMLVENKGVYGILSKGIHEMEEEECLEYFPVLKGIIEYSLMEIHQQSEKETKKKTLAQQLNSINRNLSKS